MKSKALKQEELDFLREEFNGDRHLFVVQFHGLQVVDADALRKQVREAEGRCRVVKNTLARKACQGTAAEPLEPEFRGPTAVVSTADDPARIAKTLSEFAKSNEALSVKAAVVEGTALDPQGCQELANMPSRQELLTKLAYLLQSPMQRLASVLQAPSRNLATVLQQVSEKKEG